VHGGTGFRRAVRGTRQRLRIRSELNKGSGGCCGLGLDAIDFGAEGSLSAAGPCCDKSFNGCVAGAGAGDEGHICELRGASGLNTGCGL